METSNHVPTFEGYVTQWTAIHHLKAAQTVLEGPDDRGKWLMIEQVIRSLVSRNLYENLPITSWAYDPELGQISPQHHRLKDLKNQ